MRISLNQTEIGSKFKVTFYQFSPDWHEVAFSAQEIAQRYRNQNVEIQRQSADTFHLLLDLMTYFDA